MEMPTLSEFNYLILPIWVVIFLVLSTFMNFYISVLFQLEYFHIVVLILLQLISMFS